MKINKIFLLGLLILSGISIAMQNPSTESWLTDFNNFLKNEKTKEAQELARQNIASIKVNPIGSQALKIAIDNNNDEMITFLIKNGGSYNLFWDTVLSNNGSLKNLADPVIKRQVLHTIELILTSDPKKPNEEKMASAIATSIYQTLHKPRFYLQFSKDLINLLIKNGADLNTITTVPEFGEMSILNFVMKLYDEYPENQRPLLNDVLQQLIVALNSKGAHI